MIVPTRKAGMTASGIIDPDLLLSAYRTGIFPMAEGVSGEIRWYEPVKRAVFPLDGLRISRSLRRTVERHAFETRFNTAFESVVRQCANREETWISETIIQSYGELNRRGLAFSVESWSGDELAGGHYGVALGGVFFGESMFSTQTDASKVALVALVERLRSKGFVLLDAQFMTPHLQTLGAVEISRQEYVKRLLSALELQCSFLS